MLRKKVFTLGEWFIFEVFTQYNTGADVIDDLDHVYDQLLQGKVVTCAGLKFKPLGNNKFRVYDCR